MKEWHAWVSVAALTCALLLCGLSWQVVGGTLAVAFFVLWILVEFLNLTRFIRRVVAKFAGEDPDSVDDAVSRLDRTSGEYAKTRNARQDRR